MKGWQIALVLWVAGQPALCFGWAWVMKDRRASGGN